MRVRDYNTTPKPAPTVPVVITKKEAKTFDVTTAKVTSQAPAAPVVITNTVTNTTPSVLTNEQAEAILELEKLRSTPSQALALDILNYDAKSNYGKPLFALNKEEMRGEMANVAVNAALFAVPIPGAGAVGGAIGKIGSKLARPFVKPVISTVAKTGRGGVEWITTTLGKKGVKAAASGIDDAARIAGDDVARIAGNAERAEINAAKIASNAERAEINAAKKVPLSKKVSNVVNSAGEIVGKNWKNLAKLGAAGGIAYVGYQFVRGAGDAAYDITGGDDGGSNSNSGSVPAVPDNNNDGLPDNYPFVFMPGGTSWNTPPDAGYWINPNGSGGSTGAGGFFDRIGGGIGSATGSIGAGLAANTLPLGVLALVGVLGYTYLTTPKTKQKQTKVKA